MIDSRRLARRLLSPEDQELVGGYSQNPEIIDRASLLPIGQYEDGSLTLAWPGFLKDAFEGAARSYLDAGRAPVPDAPEGARWSSNLDAFNAASIAPVAGIAGRAAGAVPRGALGSGGSDMLSGSKGIRAYHGSPHDFDRFDMSKIGTGEGAQAYGHGLYFAESEGVAKSYRDTLEKRNPVTYDSGAAVDWHDGATQAADLAKRHGSRERAAEILERSLKDNEDRARAMGRDPSQYFKLDRNTIAALRSSEQLPGIQQNPGKMYEVNINADPEQFLDWDKLPQAERDRLRSPEAAARLREDGIPGIRYLDGTSRGAGEGSYNYVVNDASLIEILRKYGLIGTAGLGAGLLGDDGEANATGLLGR